MSKNYSIAFSVLIVNIMIMLYCSFIFPMQQPPQQAVVQQPPVQQVVPVLPAPPNQALEHLINRVEEAYRIANETVHASNRSAALSNHANESAINALRRVHETANQSNQLLADLDNILQRFDNIQAMPDRVQELVQASVAAMRDEAVVLRESLVNATRDKASYELENNIEVNISKIHEKQRLGIFEQQARIQAQGAIDCEMVKWDKIRAMLTDPLCIAKAVLAVTAIAVGIYASKYAIPALINYFTRPAMVSETSRTGWFGWGKTQEPAGLDDLIFSSSLNNQLFDFVLRLQLAKMYDENLPNILFHGAPGTGKTAFAKALAHYSGLNYAITSGSEFAKITDLNDANNELRKLLAWGQDDSTGLIIVIDEAESLFANRRLSTTPKSAQDFINTFLALVPEKSQKNYMFIFSTNHPFKLDDAITNRIGIKVEFPLPGPCERKKILAHYLVKFAQENESFIVQIHPDVMAGLKQYSDLLNGFSPRAIKFIAEEMIIKARRQENRLLTTHIAMSVLDYVLHSFQQEAQWEREREQWVRMGVL